MRLLASSRSPRLTAGLLSLLSFLLLTAAAPNGAAVPFPRVEPEAVGMSSQHLQKAARAVKDIVEQRESVGRSDWLMGRRRVYRRGKGDVWSGWVVQGRREGRVGDLVGWRWLDWGALHRIVHPSFDRPIGTRTARTARNTAQARWRARRLR
jgi:hypothetical protein